MFDLNIDERRSESQRLLGSDREYFPSTETHLLASKCVSQVFKIQVMRPLQASSSNRRFPVVYATDGNAVFDMFKGLCGVLQAFNPQWPRFILVTIGYPGDSPVAGELLRGRDMTFAGCPDYFSGFPLFGRWSDVLTPEPGSQYFGGAEAFQRFIAEELIPLVDRDYETLPEDRTYFGHSLGAGFGLFMLFSQTSLFRRYVLSSPTLSYHGETPSGVSYRNHDFLLDRAREFLTGDPSLQGVKLYLSVGTQEEFEPLIANWRFTSSFYRLVALFKSTTTAGFAPITEVFSGERHATVWPIAFMHGIQALFA